MNRFFLELLNNALIASILIIVVMITRICIKKAPKWITCVLWGLVAIKLVLPFHIESMLSLIPCSKPIPVDIEYQSVPQIESGIPVINNVINPVLESNFTPGEVVAVNPMQVVVSVAFTIWIIGAVVLCLYLFISYFLLRKKVAASKNIFENVYMCDDVSSPFILGIIRPRIYLPSGMEQDTIECVLEHEKAHLKRFDHIWKPLGFFILTIYWFNPLCWLAYILLCKDIEFACDEKVTKDKDKVWKATYCQALLDCNIKRRVIAACPVAFGEVSVKDRVKSVLNYKKPAFWIIVMAVILSVVVAVCFMTSPKSDADANTGDIREESEDVGEVNGTSQNLLTMQELVRLVTSDSWSQTQQEEGIAFWDGYINLLEDATFNQESLTNLRILQLDYDGTQFELQVYYWPESSAKKEGHSVGDLEKILLRNTMTDDAILLFSNDSRDIVSTDIDSFLAKKYELPKEILTGNECEMLNGELSYSDYKADMFLNFAGCLFENSNYKEPTHGELIPKAWYSLGGIGVCTDPDYDSLETFVNGDLTHYQYTDNHMSCDLMDVFHTGEYSGCLYRYKMDLITAAETDLLKDGELGESEYWVVFFTKGPGEPLYVKFFNCDYYSQNDALESISNGADIEDKE